MLMTKTLIHEWRTKPHHHTVIISTFSTGGYEIELYVRKRRQVVACASNIKMAQKIAKRFRDPKWLWVKHEQKK